MFDSIINDVQKKFNLGDKGGSLLSALLGLIANPANGGFGGFISRFRNAGLGGLVDSWVNTGDNTPISNEQLESALGADTLDTVAKQSGLDRNTATSALGYLTPHVVDTLTPDGTVPDEASLLSKVGGFLGGIGGTVGGAVLGAAGMAGAAMGGATDKVGDAASATYNKGKDVFGGGINSVSNAAGAVGGRASSALNSVGDTLDGGDGGSILKWLIPLLLLGLLIVLGYWFCGKAPTTTTTTTNANVNANKANVAMPNAKMVDSTFKIEAKDGKYVVTGTAPDQATLDKMKAALTAQFGAGNVNFSGLKVDANAKPFAAGWWDYFAKLLPNLKDWKTGTLAFAGNAVTSAIGLPQAAIDSIKSLFSGWSLPVSIAGTEGATKQANEEALKELADAKSVDEVITALNVSIINFASGKSDIPADAKPILEKAAAVLSKQPDGTSIEIGGYTDNKGNADGNKKLSQSRADSVKKALVALGVKDSMLKAVGFGDANPVGDNNTEDGRFKNRRIEYKKSDGTAPTAATTTTTTTTNTNAAK